MKFITAGFTLIEGFDNSLSPLEHLPPLLFTASSCFCNRYPEIFTIFGNDTEYEKNIQLKLGFDDESYLQYLLEMDSLYNSCQLDNLSLFKLLNHAHSFAQTYFRNIKNLKLFELALNEQDYHLFLNQECEEDKTIFITCNNLKENQPQFLDLGFRGFDLLGYEVADFHTFSCNGLQSELIENVGISFNNYGLIDDYNKAKEACDYINQDEILAEPVNWFPWAMIEHPISF